MFLTKVRCYTLRRAINKPNIPDNNTAIVPGSDTLTADTFARKDTVQNEVIKGIVGIYKSHFLYLNDKKIPIYFKKKKLTPPNGSRLKIHYAHLSYYKTLQVVIYSKKDFELLE